MIYALMFATVCAVLMCVHSVFSVMCVVFMNESFVIFAENNRFINVPAVISNTYILDEQVLNKTCVKHS